MGDHKNEQPQPEIMPTEPKPSPADQGHGYDVFPSQNDPNYGQPGQPGGPRDDEDDGG